MLSVIIPAYNEARRLPATLAEVRKYLATLGEEGEVIVVDDGSVDDTSARVEELMKEWPELRLERHRVNRGKGAAVRTGMLAAKGELRLLCDADMSTPIDEYPKLREAIKGKVQVAIGSRALADSKVEFHQPKRREMMGRGYNKLLQWMVLPGLQDTQCGFKLFTAEAAVGCFEPLTTNRFGYDAEVLVRARRRGWEIAEVGVRWRHDADSKVSPLRDSVSTFWDLLRLRFGRVR